MVVHIFMSHTKLDKDFCDRFDIAAARVGVRVFRSEFEEIKPPAWKTIKKAMDASSAMFLLVGKELVKAQKASQEDPKLREEWIHTQNWIAYEVGLACQKGIDVWVMCDKVEINFPVPYLNNYSLYGLGAGKWTTEIEFARRVLDNYGEEKNFPLGYMKHNFKCSNTGCGAEYNLHSVIRKGGKVVCPTCLKTITFSEGWLGKEKTS